METITEILHEKHKPRVSSCDWHRSGRASRFDQARAVIACRRGETEAFFYFFFFPRTRTTNSRATLNVASPLCQDDLCGQLYGRLMLRLTYLFEWMRCFWSFTDTGDHTLIIITMVVYTSLCKCLLTPWWLSGPPHISFVLGRMASVERMRRINLGLPPEL